jgi:hypothetical protein
VAGKAAKSFDAPPVSCLRPAIDADLEDWTVPALPRCLLPVVPPTNRLEVALPVGTAVA